PDRFFDIVGDYDAMGDRARLPMLVVHVAKKHVEHSSAKYPSFCFHCHRLRGGPSGARPAPVQILVPCSVRAAPERLLWLSSAPSFRSHELKSREVAAKRCRFSIALLQNVPSANGGQRQGDNHSSPKPYDLRATHKTFIRCRLVNRRWFHSFRRGNGGRASFAAPVLDPAARSVQGLSGSGTRSYPAGRSFEFRALRVFNPSHLRRAAKSPDPRR